MILSMILKITMLLKQKIYSQLIAVAINQQILREIQDDGF
jgi:hypothetical protein